MTPANFPGRKNARRTDALQRTYRKKNQEAAQSERDHLSKVIISQSAAEAIRTKIDRSANAKFRKP